MKLDPRKHYVLKSFGRAWRKTGAAEPGREAQNAQKGGAPRLRHAAPTRQAAAPEAEDALFAPPANEEQNGPWQGVEAPASQTGEPGAAAEALPPALPKEGAPPEQGEEAGEEEEANEGEAPQKSSLLAGVRQRAGSFAASLAAFAKGRKQARAPKAEAPKPEISEEHLYKGTAAESIFMKREKPRSFVLSVFFTVLALLVVTIGAVGFAGLGAVVGIARAYIDTSPELNIGLIEDQDQTSIIYDANGEVITTFAGMENREWASIDEIPDMLKNAFVAIEDVRFYKHSGVDVKRLFSAVINTLRNQNTHGGSTITQQLIKNRVLNNEQSYKRKIQEAFLALQLEEQYSKDEILEAYLNAIPLGGLNYGVKAAAKDYFGKELSELTIRECAMLAGITQNPSRYNPRSNYYNENRDFETTNDRTDTVLAAMYNAGFITKEQYDAALVEEVTILETSTTSSMYEMAAFVEYAVDDVITYMLEDRGLENTSANRSAMENELRTGGYHIYTTVIPDVQNTVQDTLSTWENYPSIADPTYSVKISKNSDGTVDEIVQPQAAAVVIDQSTGYIVAMVGSRDEPTRKKLLNRAVDSDMPIGSSMKPIAVYAPAIENGASPASILMNFAQAIEGYGGRGYPTGGLSTQGPTTLREGVVRSMNVVAARVLFEKVGTEASKQFLVSMGVSDDAIFTDGPGLALGTSGVSMLELTTAYATLANGGVYQEPISFTTVTDSAGNVVLDARELRETHRVFKTSTAWLMTDILTDAVQSGTGWRAKISGITVAGKTGTNSDYRGVTFAGYTGYYTSALWIGHDDYAHALKSGSEGGNSAAPLWQAYMEKIHEGLEDKEIIDENPVDLGLVRVETCTVSGLLATEACGENTVTDWWMAEYVPEEECDHHVAVTLCAGSGKLATPYCPTESRTEGVVLLIPSNSQLATISAELMEEWMPDAILDAGSAEALLSAQPGSALYEEYYCSEHGPSGYPDTGYPGVTTPGGEEEGSGLQAALAALQLSDTLLTGDYSLTAAQYSTLLNMQNSLQSAINTGMSDEALRLLANNLNALCADILDSQTGAGAVG